MYIHAYMIFFLDIHASQSQANKLVFASYALHALKFTKVKGKFLIKGHR